MRDSVVGAVVGSVLTGIVSFAIFFLGNFSTQATLEKSTVETLSEYFGSVDKDMSYKEALQAVYEENKNANNEITELQEQLNGFQVQVTELTSTNNINKVIENATVYWNNKDYSQALTILKNSESLSKDIEVLYKQYSDEYCMYILDQADILVKERKYEEAKEILSIDESLVYDSSMLNEKLQTINEIRPIKLSDLKISDSRYFEIITDKAVENTIGNRYDDNNLFLIRAEGKDSYGFGTFYLGGKYSSLSGSIAISDETETFEDAQLDGWVEIYSKNGDNYEKLYTSPILNRTTSIIEIPELNINNCDWLEIRYCDNSNYYSFYYRSLVVILSDFSLYA